MSVIAMHLWSSSSLREACRIVARGLSNIAATGWRLDVAEVAEIDRITLSARPA
jgi:hypothetical protein